MKILHARELSRNQWILRFDVVLQHDWPIEQCLLHIRVFLWRENGEWRVHVLNLIFIHWLLKQVTNFYETIFQGYKKIVLFRSENCDFMHQNLSANGSGTMFDLCEAV